MLTLIPFTSGTKMTTTLKNMTEECEAILVASRNYNEENDILPTDIITINYLLNQSVAMKNVYGELSALSDQQRAQFLDQLVSTLSFWSPDNAIEMRASRNRLIDVNKKISAQAKELADLLEERSDLENHHPFTSNTHYHIANVIKEASRNNYLFRSFVVKPLEALTGQFDLKYWPHISAVINEIADDAASAEIYATDPRTEAAISSNRSSKADFVRAIFSMIDELKASLYFPQSFSLSDSSLADIVNVCLKLSAEELVDSAYVKNLRHREKKSM
jgi:hypothetical protein